MISLFPLKQGLRRNSLLNLKIKVAWISLFPLKQGLRRCADCHENRAEIVISLFPLKQGLRHARKSCHPSEYRSDIPVSIKTRIKTIHGRHISSRS